MSKHAYLSASSSHRWLNCPPSAKLNAEAEQTTSEYARQGTDCHELCAYLVEAATDNNTRTVANVRSYFTKCGGSLQTSGSVAFMFDHKCVFRIKEDPAKPIDVDELELELIDFGAEEVFKQEVEDEDENVTVEISIYGDYSAYGQIQKYIEEKGYDLISGGFEQIPNVDLKEVTPEQRATLDKLTGLLEDDEDVTNVYTTMAPEAE